MSYTKNSLDTNETISKECHISWLTTIPSIVFTLFFLIIAIICFNKSSGVKYLGTVFMITFIVGLYRLIKKIVAIITTEFTITNKRIIKKSGIFSRKVQDIPLTKVDNVTFLQRFFDRIFKEGTLIIESTSGRITLPFASNVDETKNTILKLVSEAKEKELEVSQQKIISNLAEAINTQNNKTDYTSIE